MVAQVAERVKMNITRHQAEQQAMWREEKRKEECQMTQLLERLAAA